MSEFDAWMKGCQAPLLTAEQEVLFARQYQRSLEPDASPREKRIGMRARDRMVTANLRLVGAIVLRYRARVDGATISMGDLLQEGAIGLVKGVEKFDPARGYKFSTYAYWWIRQAVTRAISEYGQTVRTPIDLQAIAHKARYMASDQTVKQFAEENGYELKRVKKALELDAQFHRLLSLDYTVPGLKSETIRYVDLVASPVDEVAELYCTSDLEAAVEALRVHEDVDEDDLALVELQSEGTKISEMASLLATNPIGARTKIAAAKERLRCAVPELREVLAA